MDYRHWHSALVTACLGRSLSGLGDTDRPELSVVVEVLLPYVDEITRLRAEAAEAGCAWPFPLPVELAEGLPRAQFAAALHAVRERLGLLGPAAIASASSRRTSAEDRRLLADKPPHWS